MQNTAECQRNIIRVLEEFNESMVGTQWRVLDCVRMSDE